jgi:uncharacterized protein (DUF4415 family)
MKKEYDFSRARRAGFRNLPAEDQQARHTKVRITIHLDRDILEHFKARARVAGAEPYQTQINRALRQLVSGPDPATQDRLLGDDRFISRLAERVAEYRARGPGRRPTGRSSGTGGT